MQDDKDNLGQEETQEQDNSPEPVRESILAAVDEVNEVNGIDKEEPKPTELDKAELEEVEKLPKGLNALAKKLSREERNILFQREREIETGMAPNRERLERYSELEKVIAPRAQMIQKYGVSPAQTIDKLFQWMELLSHPDPNTKVAALQNLAQRAGLDLTDPRVFNLPAPSPQDYQQPQLQQQQGDPVAVAKFNKYLEGFKSKNKHFEMVRGKMGKILESGILNPIDSPDTQNYDIQGAYDLAVSIDKRLSGAKLAKDAKEALKEGKIQAGVNKVLDVKPRTNGAGPHYQSNQVNNDVRGAIKKAFDAHR